MTRDFDRVTRSAQASAIAQAGRRVIAVTTAAMASSAIGAWWAGVRGSFARATPAARLRWWAITIGVAAVAHIGLRLLMSSTVSPAMPIAIYAVIAAGCALIAWQVEGFHRAARGSWVLGLGSWVMRHGPDPKTDPPGTQDHDDRN